MKTPSMDDTEVAADPRNTLQSLVLAAAYAASVALCIAFSPAVGHGNRIVPVATQTASAQAAPALVR